MNTEEPDDLVRDYQRASAADAGSPAKATRDAILAEARKAALRRQPVANDSRYLLRAVAGVAVLGVAVLIWRQQDPQLPVDATEPEYTVARKAESAADAAVSSTQSVPSPPASSPAADIAAPERRAESSTSREERMREPVRTAAPAMRSRAAGQSVDAEAESAVSPDLADASALLQEMFTPEQQVAITPPASAWMIRDSRGTVLRSGVVDSPDELLQIATSARRDFAQDVGPWTPLPATTSAGRIVELHLAELR